MLLGISYIKTFVMNLCNWLCNRFWQVPVLLSAEYGWIGTTTSLEVWSGLVWSGGGWEYRMEQDSTITPPSLTTNYINCKISSVPAGYVEDLNNILSFCLICGLKTFTLVGNALVKVTIDTYNISIMSFYIKGQTRMTWSPKLTEGYGWINKYTFNNNNGMYIQKLFSFCFNL